MGTPHSPHGKKLLLSLILLLALSLSIPLNVNPTGVSAVEYPAVMVVPESVVNPDLTPGTSFTVSIYTNYTGEDVWFWEFTLEFNPNVLHIGLNTTDIWIGDGVNKTFTLTQTPVAWNSEKVYVDEAPMTRDVNYTITYKTGEITFMAAPAPEAEVKVIYMGGGVVNGDLITKDKYPTAMFLPPKTINNTAGTMSLTGAFFFYIGDPALAPTTSGPGTFAYVTFTVVGYGASDITLGPETKLKAPTYNIIDAKRDPDHIQHGYFCNIPSTHDVSVSLEVAEEAVVGQLLTINVTVANEGTYHENVTLTVSYDNTPINTTTFTLTLTGKGLKETFSFSWNTTGVAPATYMINATATVEVDEDPIDNTDTKQITLKLAHDVSVSLEVPEEAVVGQLLTINVTVANEGTYHENVTLTVSYDTKSINTTVIDMLAPGGSKIVEFSWDTSTGVAEGNYTINVMATVTQDDDPSNNKETRSITLTLVRDVAVVSITTDPEMPVVGQLVTINVTVENHGGYSKDFEVPFTCNVTISYMTPPQIVYTNETQLVTPPIGDSTTLSFNLNTTGLTPAMYTIKAEAILAGDVKSDDNVEQKHIFVKSSLGTISGRVTDSSTGNPIAGATVTANGYSAITDSFGAYVIPDVPLGTYNVTASAEKYVNQSKTATVTAGTTTTLDFALAPLNGTLSGVVTDSSTGNPISGATVTVNGVSVSTGADGSYSIELVPGVYIVAVSAAGYEGLSESVTVLAGEVTTLNFELTPTPTPAPSGIPWHVYAATGVAVIIVAAVVFYFLKVRKPKPTKT